MLDWLESAANSVGETVGEMWDTGSEWANDNLTGWLDDQILENTTQDSAGNSDTAQSIHTPEQQQTSNPSESWLIWGVIALLIVIIIMLMRGK